jgi:cysteinyl-tRNA synthetase
MAEDILGVDFEIHGGGTDLIFPHHENELAQTHAARGSDLARIWMHNGMIRFADEKMSKSVGNIRLLHEALDEVGREALLMYFATGHYRQPLLFSQEALSEASRSVQRIRDFLARLDRDVPTTGVAAPYAERFFDALRDDFNAPAARAALFDWVAEGNRRLDLGERLGLETTPVMLWALGLESLVEEGRVELSAYAEQLLSEREAARAARDFESADNKRRELEKLGWEVRDTPKGPQLVPRH